jgi:DNA-binding CsgD family transcriptional regulator
MGPSQLYVVQVWHQPQGWRASAQRVGEEHTRWFDDKEALTTFLRTPPAPAAVAKAALTSREGEVALLFAAGSNHKRIALRLGLAPATVRNHLSACYRKLGVDNRGALLAAMGAVTTPYITDTPLEQRAPMVHLHHGAAQPRPTDWPAVVRQSGTAHVPLREPA